MTVCIASIYNNTSVLGASDKMLTNFDIEFEPDDKGAKKVYPLTRNIVLMTAGGSSIHGHLLSRIRKYINDRLEEDSSTLLPVADVAAEYEKLYRKYRREVAQATYLTPLGLTNKSFLSLQRSMEPSVVVEITKKLESFRFSEDEDIAAIIAGIDEQGPHLYSFQYDKLICFDNIGFTAIGSGAYHALSHLELAGLSRYAFEAKALMSVHRAKKKAEVSPGVGKATDMFVIGPEINSFNWLEPEGTVGINIVADLDKFYESYLKNIAVRDKKEEGKVSEYLNQLGSKAQAQQGIDPDDNSNDGTEGRK